MGWAGRDVIPSERRAEKQKQRVPDGMDGIDCVLCEADVVGDFDEVALTLAAQPAV